MGNQSNKAVIGAFVLSAVAIIVVGILAFGSGKLFRRVDRFVLYFDGDLKGLNVGSPVTFRGVRIGEVTDVNVVVNRQTLEFKIPVYIEIEPGRIIGAEAAEAATKDPLAVLIRRGLRAQLALQSLVTGQLMVRLDFFEGRAVEFRGDGSGYRELPTVPSKVEELTSALETVSFQEIADKLNLALDKIAKALEEGHLEKIVVSTESALEEIRSVASKLNRRIDPLTDRYGKVAEDVSLLTRDMRRAIGSVDRQVGPLLKDASETLQEARLTLKQLEQTLVDYKELAEGYSPDSQFHHQFNTVLKEVSAAARSMRVLTDLLYQQPDAPLRGKGRFGGAD